MKYTRLSEYLVLLYLRSPTLLQLGQEQYMHELLTRCLTRVERCTVTWKLGLFTYFALTYACPIGKILILTAAMNVDMAER